MRQLTFKWQHSHHKTKRAAHHLGASVIKNGAFESAALEATRRAETAAGCAQFASTSGPPGQ